MGKSALARSPAPFTRYQQPEEAIMVRLNKHVRARTHEGAIATRFPPEQALRRTLMNCLLWEDQFYEDGVSLADRIKALVAQVQPERGAALAIAAREQMKLRQAPLLVVREM